MARFSETAGGRLSNLSGNRGSTASLKREINMKIPSFALAATVAAFAAITAATTVLAEGPDALPGAITTAFAYQIANVPGKKLTALIVSYPPGGKTPPHRHGSAFVVGYVLSGAILSKVDNGKEQVFHVGESWMEKPGAHHMGGNASDTEPAKLLAIFVADTKQDELVTLDKK
jgi:quercetin dioxygenase-like cupin family protein